MSFVERIFDIELPRATRLSEMAPKSVYFFREPDYAEPKVEAFFATLKPAVYGEYSMKVQMKL